jgi:hypothetical protein
MDSLEDGKKTARGFFKYVFNFEQDGKAEIINTIQFALIAIIPVFLLNKSIQKVFPVLDEENSSLKIISEILGQILSMYLGLIVIKRAVYYIPTYSGTAYPQVSIIYEILTSLMVVLSIQSKVGEKCNLLFERLVDYWSGVKKNDKKKKSKNAKSSSSVAVQQQPPQMQMMSVGGFTDGTSINQLPNYDERSSDSHSHSQQQQQQHQSSAPPMPPMMQEPMAANDALGGGFGGFSSW